MGCPNFCVFVQVHLFRPLIKTHDYQGPISQETLIRKAETQGPTPKAPNPKPNSQKQGPTPEGRWFGPLRKYFP